MENNSKLGSYCHQRLGPKILRINNLSTYKTYRNHSLGYSWLIKQKIYKKHNEYHEI